MKKIIMLVSCMLCIKNAQTEENKKEFTLAATHHSSTVSQSDLPVTPVTSFSECLHILEKCDSETLILFDIDNTLISSHDVFARSYSVPKDRQEAIEEYLGFKIDENTWHKISVSLWQLAERRITENFAQSFINALKNKGSTVLALTASETGSFGIMHDMAHWRYQMLKHFGITFSTHHEDKVFTALKPFRSYHPSLYKGILSTNRVTKGELLQAFLDALEKKPKHIIFFDDTIHHVHVIGETCKKNNIPCSLFHYQGAAQNIPVTFDSFHNAAKVQVLLNNQRIDDLHFYEQ